MTTTPTNAGGDRRVYCDDCMGGVFSPDGVHIDPTTELNRLLDRERAALAAVRELREAAQVAANRLESLGHGSTDPHAVAWYRCTTALANTKDIA